MESCWLLRVGLTAAKVSVAAHTDAVLCQTCRLHSFLKNFLAATLKLAYIMNSALVVEFDGYKSRNGQADLRHI